MIQTKVLPNNREQLHCTLINHCTNKLEQAHHGKFTAHNTSANKTLALNEEQWQQGLAPHNPKSIVNQYWQTL